MNIGRWLVHSVSRKRRTGEGAKGDPTFGAVDTIRCRVEKRAKRVRGADGVEVVSEFSLVTSTLNVSEHDVFWFPAIAGEAADVVGDTSTGRTPIAVERATTISGQAPFVTVYF